MREASNEVGILADEARRGILHHRENGGMIRCEPGGLATSGREGLPGRNAVDEGDGQECDLDREGQDGASNQERGPPPRPVRASSLMLPIR